MYTLSVTVTNLRSEVSSEASARRFWSFIEKDSLDQDSLVFEGRLRNSLARELSRRIQTHALRVNSRHSMHETVQLNDSAMLRQVARLIFTLEEIKYGSLKMEIGIPDPDALIETFGNNIDVLKAVFDAYIPEAFADSMQMGTNILEPLKFDSQLPREMCERARASAPDSKPDKSQDAASAATKGTQFVAALVSSPLIFPVILIVFLWYLARQDVMAERQMLSNMMQITIQQQTATLAVLKDALEKSAAESKPATNSCPTK